MSMSYNYPPQMAYPSAPPVYRAFPAPPRLHWEIVFALSVVTLGIFGMVWMIVQANWVKKVTRNVKPLWWSVAHLVYVPVWICAGAVVGVIASFGKGDNALWFLNLMEPLIRFVGFGFYLAAAYSLKGVLEERPIDIPLSGVMTFFFAPTYFQYHLYDYSVEGKVGEQLSGFAEPEAKG